MTEKVAAFEIISSIYIFYGRSLLRKMQSQERDVKRERSLYEGKGRNKEKSFVWCLSEVWNKNVPNFRQINILI